MNWQELKKFKYSKIYEIFEVKKVTQNYRNSENPSVTYYIVVEISNKWKDMPEIAVFHVWTTPH